MFESEHSVRNVDLSTAINNTRCLSHNLKEATRWCLKFLNQLKDTRVFYGQCQSTRSCMQQRGALPYSNADQFSGVWNLVHKD